VEDVKTCFTLALESYAAYADIVQQNNKINETQVDLAFQELERGSRHLREALDGLDQQTLHVPAEVVAVNLSVAQPSAVPADALMRCSGTSTTTGSGQTRFRSLWSRQV
jgi:response regulator of citrate/malate metabolism